MSNATSPERTFPLGELEEAIMRVVWKQGPVTVRDVHERLHRNRPCAYTTVMTVMGRLVGKRILKRTPLANGAYRYAATQPRERFAAATTKRILDQLLTRFGDVAIAQFADAIEDVEPAKLRKLHDQLSRNRHGKG